MKDTSPERKNTVPLNDKEITLLYKYNQEKGFYAMAIGIVGATLCAFLFTMICLATGSIPVVMIKLSAVTPDVITLTKGRVLAVLASILVLFGLIFKYGFHLWNFSLSIEPQSLKDDLRNRPTA